MDRRKVKALVSSLASHSLLFLLLSPATFRSLSPHPDSKPAVSVISLTLLCYFLSSQQLTATICIRSSRKRKRPSVGEPEGRSSDDELKQRIRQHGPTRCPETFRSDFGMSSRTFEWLLGFLEPLLECRDPVGSPINLPSHIRLGIGLNRLATGSSYTDIASRFGTTEPVARFCTKQLCRVLCTNFRFWVAFPCAEELNIVSNSFEELTGLPNCCGVIDCVRFNVLKNNAVHVFGEKSDSDSLTVQLIVDSSSRILNVVAGIRGDKRKSDVLKLSTLHRDIEEKKVLNSHSTYVNGVEVNRYLIGGGEYPLLPWLMVPFSDAAVGSSEEKFNRTLNLMRISTVKTIGSLKGWGALKEPIREGFKTAVGFIGACSILHNVLLMREDAISPFEEFWGLSMDNRRYNGRDSYTGEKALGIRRALVARVSSIQDESK